MGPALDPVTAERAIRSRLPEAEAGWLGALTEIHVLNHRPGRRCVISYRFEPGPGPGPGNTGEPQRYIGKVRAKGPNRRADKLARSLRDRGFTKQGRFGFTVAEPLGTIDALDMALQRFHAGASLTGLALRGGSEACDRFEEVGIALCELHRHGIPSDRRHTVGDEFAILEERLPRVAQALPGCDRRIQRILERARALAGRLTNRPSRPIHRDFHPDQVLAPGDDLVLLDLDLYTMGDPALDVGNFVAHLQELGLRERGDAGAFRDLGEAFVRAYLASSSETTLEDVLGWTHLSFIRHVEIAWRIEARRPTLPAILVRCEEEATALGLR